MVRSEAKNREQSLHASGRRLPIPLYLPNLLGYGRIVLALVGLHQAELRPALAIKLWIFSGTLDFFDGMLARMLDQCSSFGVFVDIAADNVLRTATWLAAASSAKDGSTRVISACVISLEWYTMVSTQLHSNHQGGKHWKREREKDPYVVKMFFRHNFRNPLGTLGIYGLFSCGIFVMASNYPDIVDSIPYFFFLQKLAYLGRLISAIIEVWFCCTYLRLVLQSEVEPKVKADS